MKENCINNTSRNPKIPLNPKIPEIICSRGVQKTTIFGMNQQPSYSHSFLVHCQPCEISKSLFVWKCCTQTNIFRTKNKKRIFKIYEGKFCYNNFCPNRINGSANAEIQKLLQTPGKVFGQFYKHDSPDMHFLHDRPFYITRKCCTHLM